MKKYSFIFICLVSAFFFFSCIITPQARETSPNSGVPEYRPPTVTLAAPTPTAPAPVALTAPTPTASASAVPAAPTPTTPPIDAITQVDPPETLPHETPTEEAILVAAVTGQMAVYSAAVLPPVSPGRTQVPEYIMGKGVVSQKEMAAFLLESNLNAERAFINELAYIYTEEAAVEGVNSDVAFAQMCLETGFLRFGGLVTADMNNFCGLGAIGPYERGLSFPNPRMGVRAHIQHLKAYATEEPLKQLLVDPRFHYVNRGSSPAIDGLAGTWAQDPAYADKINSILERLYNFYYEL